MREHKFRAWDKKEKRYYYFDFGSMYGYEGEVCGVLTGEEGSWGGIAINYNSGYSFDGINPDIVIEEYTGRRDSKGRRIFEGDILTGKQYGEPKTILVEWYEGHEGDGWMLNGFVIDLDDHHPVAVIGNRYETPELIPEQ